MPGLEAVFWSKLHLIVDGIFFMDSALPVLRENFGSFTEERFVASPILSYISL